MERFHPKDRERLCDELFRGEGVSRVLELFGNGDRWVEFSAKAFPGGGEAVGRVVGVMRDVTDAHQIQAQLRQASAVFETTSEGIAITDAARRIVSTNPAFSRITGYTAAEVLGRDPDDILHARRHGDQFNPRLAESRRRPLERRDRLQAQERRSLSGLGTPVRGGRRGRRHHALRHHLFRHQRAAPGRGLPQPTSPITIT